MSEKVKVMIDYFVNIARNPKEAILKTMSETGKKAFGVFPYYTPEEVIYAGGMLPVGMWGGQTDIKLADKYLQSFCCSLMKANIEYGMKKEYDFLSACIIPAYCDTLKCIIENWKVAVPQVPVVPMVYPNNKKIRAGVDFMISEFERVRKAVEEITGNKITEEDLEKGLAVYEEYRKTMKEFVKFINDYPNTFNAKVRHLILKAAFFSDKAIYTEKIKELMAEVAKLPKEEFKGVKAIVTGIMVDSEEILDVFVENNVFICGDDLAHESRQFRTLVTEGTTALEKMAIRISNQNCAMLYDEKKTRGSELIKLAKETGADACIVAMLKFCDPEEFDYPIYKKELEAANLPMLYLEIEQKMTTIEQIRTRVQSFIEVGV